MHSLQETLKLKRAPTDIWSIREQLCLASSVLKSGDQNWISVSRSLKAIGEKDLHRSSDWFSQKSCAQQYACLLENTDIPKRKKRESGETTSESIVRRLTQDRIVELSKTLSTQREEYQQMKNEICLLKNGTISLEKLQKMCSTIEQEEKELDQNSKAHFNISTKQIKNENSQFIQLASVEKDENKVIDSFTIVKEVSQTCVDNDDQQNMDEQSSLLTTLLKSSSPTTQLQTQTQPSNSPTIASLLCSSPKVPVSVSVQNVCPQLNNQIVCSAIPNIQEQSSISAPTLSKLLEQPSTSMQINSKQEMNSLSNNSKNMQNSSQVPKIRTRSARLAQGTTIETIQVSRANSNQEITNSETNTMTHSPIDKIIQEALPTDKDEINEIIGDLEEFIKEEITKSPQSLDSTINKIASIENLNIITSPTTIVRSEPRNVDDSASLSNSPTSEMAIEEIDSSSSNIAKIIGTAVEEMESKMETNDPSATEEQITTFTDNYADNSITKELNITNEITQKTNISKNCLNTQSNELRLVQSSDNINLETVDKQILDESITFDKTITNQKEIRTEKYASDYLVENRKQNYDYDLTTICDRELSNKHGNISKENVSMQLIQKSRDVPISEQCNVEPIEKQNRVEENTFGNENHCHKIISDVDNDYTSDEIMKIKFSVPKIVDTLLKKYETEESSTNPKDTSDGQLKCDKKILSPSDLRMSKNFIVNDILIKEYPTVIQSDNRIIKKEILQESIDELKENDGLENSNILSYVKNEHIECDSENTDSDEFKKEKDSSHKNVEIKQVSVETTGNRNEVDDDEPAITKLQGGRAIKTYSKKQNATIDNETDIESSWENADYRAWKKSIMLVYHRLSTNKYASIFLRPITEDQAPGYHSIIFKPMDLSTIKKNIDNGTIRSTSHFQRDVMLMFQNAIMYNKYNTFVHKMTLEMQEECLHHMQILVHAAGEASFKRETRTATNTSSETSEVGFKRKWTHINFSPYEIESHKNKKRRKSENE